MSPTISQSYPQTHPNGAHNVSCSPLSALIDHNPPAPPLSAHLHTCAAARRAAGAAKYAAPPHGEYRRAIRRRLVSFTHGRRADSTPKTHPVPDKRHTIPSRASNQYIQISCRRYMRHKMISLDNVTLERAKKMDNFSAWVRSRIRQLIESEEELAWYYCGYCNRTYELKVSRAMKTVCSDCKDEGWYFPAMKAVKKNDSM